ncbi:MAG: hypothetical protein R2744_11070 [Bacteroidales bacterium]
MIDTNSPFHSSHNWRYSVDRNGGTPGLPNSVEACNPDTEQPWLSNVYPLNDSVISVFFSEPVDMAGIPVADWKVEGVATESVSNCDLLRENYLLGLGESLNDINGYTLEVPGAIKISMATAWRGYRWVLAFPLTQGGMTL